MGVHVAHPPGGHGPAEVASSRRGDLLSWALPTASVTWIEVGQSAELGCTWWHPGGVPRSAPRASQRIAVD